MSDARWFEVEVNMAAASRHFRRSVEIFGRGNLLGDDYEEYQARMALMHAMQSGHTSLENGLLKILAMLGEKPPVGAEWHADLVRRASHAVEVVTAAEQALERPDVAGAVDLTRSFRHVAMRGYENFREDLARPAVDAAGYLAQHVEPAVAAFRRAIDPD